MDPVVENGIVIKVPWGRAPRYYMKNYKLITKKVVQYLATK